MNADSDLSFNSASMSPDDESPEKFVSQVSRTSTLTRSKKSSSPKKQPRAKAHRSDPSPLKADQESKSPEPQVSKKKRKQFKTAEQKRRQEQEAFGPNPYFFQDFMPTEKTAATFWIDEKIHDMINSGSALTPENIEAFLTAAEGRKLLETETHSALLRERVFSLFHKQAELKGFKEFGKFADLLESIVNRSMVPRPIIQQPMFFPSKENEIHLARVLRRARKSIYAAVFTFTNNRLAEALIERFQAGVDVQVITDDECSKFSGADIYRLGALGIPCTMDKHKRYHMHHKFAILDGRILVTGSFNWSSQAVTGNQENLIVLDNPELCKAYKGEFDKLWEDFAGQRLKKEECIKKVEAEERANQAKRAARSKKKS